MLISINTFLNNSQLFAITCFSFALLTGCNDDDHRRNTSSSSSSSLSSTSSSNSSSATTASTYVGQWYAPAYGYILSVSTKDNSFTTKTYSLTTDYCLLQNIETHRTQSDFQKNYVYLNNTKEILRKNTADYLPAVEFEKLESLPKTCEQDLQKVKTDVGYTFDAKRDFSIFWQTFNELYINFGMRGVNWNEAYDEALQALDNVTNEKELFAFLSNLIDPLGDPHVILLNAPLSPDLTASLEAALANDATPIFSSATQLSLYQKLLNEYLQTLNADDELTAAQIAAAENYVLEQFNKIQNTILSYASNSSEIEVRAAGEIAWFTTADNIGYLLIDSMSDYRGEQTAITSGIDADVAIAEATINEALHDLVNTKGLIIDARFNEGGHDQVALTFVRHFISQPRVVYSKFAGSGVWQTPAQEVVLEPQGNNIYAKPTAVLISGDTGSAAEVFTIAMASLPQVALIGEPTAGAFSDILIKRLTSNIAFGISNETYLDTQGNNYEGIGIPADIIVPFATQQERKDGYDAGIDSAINWINNAP